MAGAGIAIVAGRGRLPRLIAEDCVRRGRPYAIVAYEGVPLDWLADHPVIPAIFEKPGRLFADLRTAGLADVTFAGGMQRPRLNPLRFDLKMLQLAPKVVVGARSGDDTTLRLVATIFEAEGLRLVPPQDLIAGLIAPEGVLTRASPSEADRTDAARAARIVEVIGAEDLGQGAVVAQGLCLGLESIQGTDAMLELVARTAEAFRFDPDGGRGVLFKGPKPGQDLRLDLPAIGPDTVQAAASAGLAGIAVRAGGVLILGQSETVAAADAAGLFLWGRGAEG